MQKINKNKLSINKTLEILNSGECTYSIDEATEISNNLTKLSQLIYQYWNEKSNRKKSNSLPES